MMKEQYVVAANSNPEDIGDMVAQVQVQFQCLGWTPAQAKSWIAEQFGGRSWWQLTDAELVVLLRKLRDCASLEKPVTVDYS